MENKNSCLIFLGFLYQNIVDSVNLFYGTNLLKVCIYIFWYLQGIVARSRLSLFSGFTKNKTFYTQWNKNLMGNFYVFSGSWWMGIDIYHLYPEIIKSDLDIPSTDVKLLEISAILKAVRRD